MKTLEREPGDELREAVLDAASRLLALPDEQASQRPAPGKWSRKELVGHLIDSAANNHARFVRARFQEDLVFPTYDQDAWVGAQPYQDAPWRELVALWRDYNLHLARLMDSTPAAERTRPRARHNLDRIAFVRVPADRPASLEDLMRDYVLHLRHHLRQALG